MDLALTPRNNSKSRRKSVASATPANGSQYAIDEINAYIAVRNGLLKKAEQAPTEHSLERLVLANNFVANCLRPTRQPYITQYLPDVDAVRELKECHAVDARITKLRASLVSAA